MAGSSRPALRSLLMVTACGLVFSLPLRGSVPRGLDDIIFDYVAASQCGMLTSEIKQGFHTDWAAVTARLGLSPNQARVFRVKGWIAAERKWRDHPAIGPRATCQTEGAAAATRFSEIAAGALVP